MNAFRQRLERLEAHARASAKPADQDFLITTDDEEAWADVTGPERAHLRELHRRCGGGDRPILVTRRSEQWALSTFNTPFGRAHYIIDATLRELGDERFIEVLMSLATEAEIDSLVRATEANWNPEGLQDGDGLCLERLADRLPRA